MLGTPQQKSLWRRVANDVRGVIIDRRHAGAQAATATRNRIVGESRGGDGASHGLRPEVASGV